MVTAVAFVALAAVGTIARAAAGRRWNRRGGLPLGTLVVNVSGSAALGLLHGVAPPAATVVGTGLLGAYTTFSTLVADTAALARADPDACAETTSRADPDACAETTSRASARASARARRTAAAYLAVTLVAGLVAAATGRALAP